MSSRFAIVPARALDDIRMTPAALRVLLEFGRHTDRAGWCKLKQETIAERLGVGRQAVNNQVVLLRQWGYLEKGKQLAPGRANFWRVLHDPHLPSRFDRLHNHAEEDLPLLEVPREMASEKGAVPRLEMAPGATSGDGTEGTPQKNGKDLSEGRAASAAPSPMRTPLNGNGPPKLDVQELITLFVDVSREYGSEPTGKVKGNLATQLKRLEREGKTRRVLRMAVGVMAEEGKPVGHLDYIVGDMEREIAGVKNGKR